MTLPQANLKAKDLDRSLVPHKEVVKAYQDVGQEYEKSCHDRAYEWFYSQVTGKESIKNQPVEQTINQLHRVKDSKGEWLVYGVGLSADNWKRNRVDFFHMEGIIEGIPTFHNEIDPQTEEIIPATTQVMNMKTIYTIPFSKKKVDELSQYFAESAQFAITDRGAGNRTYSCTLEEFRDLPYEELVKLKTSWMFTDYHRSKQLIEARGVK